MKLPPQRQWQRCLAEHSDIRQKLPEGWLFCRAMETNDKRRAPPICGDARLSFGQGAEKRSRGEVPCRVQGIPWERVPSGDFAEGESDEECACVPARRRPRPQAMSPTTSLNNPRSFKHSTQLKKESQQGAPISCTPKGKRTPCLFHAKSFVCCYSRARGSRFMRETGRT